MAVLKRGLRSRSGQRGEMFGETPAWRKLRSRFLDNSWALYRHDFVADSFKWPLKGSTVSDLSHQPTSATHACSTLIEDSASPSKF